ncbi:helix-turn-helix domain-containing protein [Nocardia sp. NPDC050435]|uniref:MmyB family transcriptional regulator n=1 Tax=Nocardia sp. NPDC050435 TaxID=3155040 RepID=UPI0033EC266C
MSNNSSNRTGKARYKPPSRVKTWPPKNIPDFGLWFWRFREHRNLTQEGLARKANCSLSLVTKIEGRNHLPERKTLDQFITALELDEAQSRMLIELWYPPLDLTATDYLRSRFIAVGGLKTLDFHERHGVRAMAHTYLWDVLAANPSAQRTMPGLAEAKNNYMRWAFSPAGQEAIVGWEHEAPQFVAACTAMFARHRDAPRAQHLYATLVRIPEFAQRLSDQPAIAYGCPPDELIHRLDPTTDAPVSMSIQTSDHFGTAEVYLTCAFEHAYSGPARW